MRQLRLALLLAAAMYPPCSHASDDTVAFYEICVNGRCGNAVGVLSDSEGRHWIDGVAFADLAVDTTRWPHRDHEGGRYVDPLAGFPDASIHVDEATLRLELALPATAWSAQEYRSGRRGDRPDVTLDAGRSAYLDYTLFKYNDAKPAGFGETGVVQGPWLARSTFDVNGDGVRRGTTAIEYDQPSHRRRWTLGDQYLVAGDAFGAAALIGGIGVASAFDLDPYLVTFPGADIRGVMQAPGTIEVYANGVLVSRQEALPGPFSLRDLTLAQGSNDVRVVVDDPFAGRQEFGSRHYVSSRLLARGLHDYAYRAGRLRPDLREGGYEDRTLLSAWHRYGFTDWITASLRYERLEDRRNVGAAIDLRLPLGSLGITVARSDNRQGGHGWARRADYGFQHRRFSLAMGWRREDAGYIPLLRSSLDSEIQASNGDRYANLSLALPREATLSARFSQLDYRDSTRIRNAGVRLSMRLGGRAQWSVDAGRREERDGQRTSEFSLSVYVPLDRMGLSFSASKRTGDTLDYVAGIQRSTPSLSGGWGYRAEGGRQADQRYGHVALDRTSETGRLDLSAAQRAGLHSHSVRFTGSLLWAAGAAYPIQTGTGGHALIRTTGAEGIRIQREHQEAGRTNAQGRLLVAGLLPYQANLISIDPKELGIGTRIDDPERYVSTRRHGVALVDFDVRNVTAVQAYLGFEQAGSKHRMKYGTATLDTDEGEKVSARIGDEGQVYLEDVAPGRHVLAATTEAGEIYRCNLVVPAGESMVWIGEVICTPK